jgi:aminopeptidase N
MQTTAEEIEFYNLVAVHEMAHQWWGHLVGWKTYHDQWLSEGFAEFSAALYLQMFDPKKWNTFWDLKRKWLLSKNKEGHRPVDVGPLWLNYQLNAYNEEGNSQLLIYQKGAYVLQMLREMLWDPTQKTPDARFITMMRDFVSTHAAKNASTEDFRRVVEKHMGKPMDWFFNEWVYGTETPHYDFSYQLKDGPGGKTILQVSIAQSEVSSQFAVEVPVYVFVKGQPRRLGVLKTVGTTSFTTEIPLNFRPEKVTIDETRDILCTVRQ